MGCVWRGVVCGVCPSMPCGMAWTPWFPFVVPSGKRDANVRAGVYAAAGVVAVVGASYASVPLYQMFCKVRLLAHTAWPGGSCACACAYATVAGASVPVTLVCGAGVGTVLVDPPPPCERTCCCRRRGTVAQRSQGRTVGRTPNPCQAQPRSRCISLGTPPTPCPGSFSPCSSQ